MEDVKLPDERSWYKDTICVCGHWFEEHFLDSNGTPCEACTSNAVDFAEESRCSNFVFDPELNSPEAIADRGGQHDLRECDCALCDADRKKFITEVREMFVRDEEWCTFENPGRIPMLFEKIGFGPRLDPSAP